MPTEKGIFMTPLIDSDGIHDRATTKLCTRMAARYDAGARRGRGGPRLHAGGLAPLGSACLCPSPVPSANVACAAMGPGIPVSLEDPTLIARAGVRALLNRDPDFEIVGEAADYDELLAGAEEAAPQVLVSDIRMPPTFQREGIEAAHALRKRHPGTGVVILSQYDDPEYAIQLLSEGQAGYAYLLKDRLAEGDQLADAIRAVASGGSALDPAIVDAMVQQAIVDREEQGETLSRLLPGGLAEKVRREGQRIGETEEVEVTVLMSDIRWYSGIAEHAQPSALARQL